MLQQLREAETDRKIVDGYIERKRDRVCVCLVCVCVCVCVFEIHRIHKHCQPEQRKAEEAQVLEQPYVPRLTPGTTTNHHSLSLPISSWLKAIHPWELV